MVFQFIQSLSPFLFDICIQTCSPQVIPEQITWLSHGLKLASPVLGYDTKQASLQHGGSRVLQNVSKFRLVLQTKQYRRKMLYS